MTIYKWGKDTSRRPWWRLRPSDSPDWHVLNSIATIRSQDTYDFANHKNVRQYNASYTYYAGTGHPNTGWALFKSIPAARRWVESQLAQFWEPPQVES